MSIKLCKKTEMIKFYFVIKKNHHISFPNGPEQETTSLILGFTRSVYFYRPKYVNILFLIN